MNIFVRIVNLENFTYSKVKYYSIRFEESDDTEFEDFLTRMEGIPDYEEDVLNLFAWLELIGENEGANERFFRHEGSISDAKALPPRARIMHTHELFVRDIRLYCQRLNEQVVILFNGGIKTEAKAQDCPNVSGYFNQANRISKQINELFKSKEITWNHNFSDIKLDEDLTIEI